jgi:hypothetical protein
VLGSRGNAPEAGGVEVSDPDPIGSGG